MNSTEELLKLTRNKSFFDKSPALLMLYGLLTGAIIVIVIKNLIG